MLATLPSEISVNILSCGILTSKEVRHVARVSKAWANLTRFEGAWRALAVRWRLAYRSSPHTHALAPGVRERIASLVAQQVPYSTTRERIIEGICSNWRLLVSLLDLCCVLATGHALNGDADTTNTLVPRTRIFCPGLIQPDDRPLWPHDDSDRNLTGRFNNIGHHAGADFSRDQKIAQLFLLDEPGMLLLETRAARSSGIVAGWHLVPLDGSAPTWLFPPLNRGTQVSILAAKGRWIVLSASDSEGECSPLYIFRFVRRGSHVSPGATTVSSEWAIEEPFRLQASKLKWNMFRWWNCRVQEDGILALWDAMDLEVGYTEDMMALPGERVGMLLGLEGRRVTG